MTSPRSLWDRIPVAFVPKLVTVLREGYGRRDLAADVMAGVIVGIVALPLAIAFGIASGVTPSQGLYTAIVGGFLISLLGGCRVQVGGPTGAFVVLIAGLVHKYGYDGLATATFLAGLMLIVMGIGKLGVIIQYIPFPVTVGFTSGIALIIAIGQIPSLLGLRVANDPSEVLSKLAVYARSANTISWTTTGVGMLALALAIYFPKLAGFTGKNWLRKIPGSLVAVVVTTAVVGCFHLNVATIGTRFGDLPSSVPMPRMPHLSLALARELFQPAIAIALLAGIESLLSAVVADGMTGRRHRSNVELIAQGAANIGSTIFGGIPVTGAIARTATNIKNGAKSPIAGIVHALVLLLIVLFLGRWAKLIPLTTLAAVLFVVAYNMSEWRTFVKLFSAPRSDLVVLLTTFLLTIVIDLTVAIEVGVVLASLLFIRRMSEVSQVESLTRQLRDDEEEPADPLSIELRDVPEGVVVYEVFGAFFFGAVDKFRTILAELESHPRVIIIRMRHVLVVDSSGLKFLEEMMLRCRKDGIVLILSGVHMQPLGAMDKSGLLDELGADRVFSHIDLALAAAREALTQVTTRASLPASRRSIRTSR